MLEILYLPNFVVLLYSYFNVFVISDVLGLSVARL